VFKKDEYDSFLYFTLTPRMAAASPLSRETGCFTYLKDKNNNAIRNRTGVIIVIIIINRKEQGRMDNFHIT
jgi:hypothetical protein